MEEEPNTRSKSERNLRYYFTKIVRAIMKRTPITEEEIDMVILYAQDNTYEEVGKKFNFSGQSMKIKIERTIGKIGSRIDDFLLSLEKQEALEKENERLLALITFFEKELVEKGLVISDEELSRGITREAFLRTPIRDADLDLQTRNRLQSKAEFETMGDVIAFHRKSHVIKIPKFGKKMYEELKKYAAKNYVEM